MTNTSWNILFGIFLLKRLGKWIKYIDVRHVCCLYNWLIATKGWHVSFRLKVSFMPKIARNDFQNNTPYTEHDNTWDPRVDRYLMENSRNEPLTHGSILIETQMRQWTGPSSFQLMVMVVTCSTPNHYLNQHFINYALRNICSFLLDLQKVTFRIQKKT